MPVEKWKTQLNNEIIKHIVPQPLWKTCGKLAGLWKFQTQRHFSTISTGRFFAQPVEKWKTFFNLLQLKAIYKRLA
jgi:hypothetical protein